MGGYFRYRKGDEPIPQHTLIEQLGKGGFGEVWKARGPGGFYEALKIIDLTGNEGAKEFASLEVVRTMQHPNLVPIHGCWLKAEDQRLLTEDSFRVMSEGLEGGARSTAKTQTLASRPVELLIAMALGEKSLQTLLEQRRAEGNAGIPVEELLEYMFDAAKAIDYLNDKSPPIVHGDVKPHNILIAGNSAQLCDFGLCKAVQDIRKTQPTPVTVAYAAPESFSGKPTPKSDQYSLAITYVELRTGRLPFDDDSLSYPYKLMEAHKRGLLRLEALGEEVRKVIRRATHQDATQRWPTSRALVRALAQAEQISPTESNTTPITPLVLPHDSAGKTPGRTSDYSKRTPRGSTDDTILPPKNSDEGSPYVTSRPPSDQRTLPDLLRPDASTQAPPSRVQTRREQSAAAGRKAARLAAVVFATLLLGALGYGGYRWLRPVGSADEVRQLIASSQLDAAKTMIDDPELPVLPADKKQLQKEWQQAWEKESLDLARAGKLQEIEKRLGDPLSDSTKGFKERLQDEYRRSWQNQFAGLLHDGKVSEARTQLADAGPLIPAETVTMLSERWLDAWIDQQRSDVANWNAKNDPLVALDAVRGKLLSDTAVEHGKSELCLAWRTWAEKQRSQQVSFADLKAILQSAPASIAAIEQAEIGDLRSTAAEQWKKERAADSTPKDSLAALGAASEVFPKEQLAPLSQFAMGQWVKKAVDRSEQYDKPTVASASQLADELLQSDKLSPDMQSQLHLIKARAAWLAKDSATARSELKAVADSSPLPEKAKLLYAGLSVLTSQRPDGDPQQKELVGKFTDIRATAWNQGAYLQLNPFERKEIDNFVAATAHDSNPGPLLTRPTNDALAAVQKSITEKKFAEARTTLRKINDLPTADRQYYETLIALADPQAVAAEIDQWFSIWADTYAGVKQPEQREALVAALSGFVRRDPAAPADALGRSIQMVNLIRGAAKDDVKLAALHAELCSKRILSVLAGTTEPPTPAVIKQVDDDYRMAGVLHSPGVDEFWLECLSRREKPSLSRKDVADAMQALAKRAPADPHFRYSRFVLAVMASVKPAVTRSPADWRDIHDRIEAAFDAKGAGASILERAKFRRELAAQLLVDSIAQLYPRQSPAPGGDLAVDEFLKLLDQPYASAADADAATRGYLLAAQLSPTIVQGPKYQVDFALASWFRNDKPGADPAPTAHALGSLADQQKLSFSAGDDAKFEQLLGDDVVTALVVGFEAQRRGGNPTTAIRFATRLARLAAAEKWFIRNDKMATAIYERVLAPAQLLADDALAKKDGRFSDLPEYYGETARFIDTYHYLNVADAWPKTKPLRCDKIEELLDHAIDDLGRRDPDYFVRRGNSFIAADRAPPKLSAAMDDAGAALKELQAVGVGVAPGQKGNADLAAALRLRGLVQLLDARQSRCYAKRLDGRTAALKDLDWVNNGGGAEVTSVDDRALGFIYESMLRLEQGNDLADVNAKYKELSAAVAAAQNANKQDGQHYPELAFEALGNAYEDVASQVLRDTDDSYQKALEAFDAAINVKPLAMGLNRDRGRCFYKYFVWRTAFPKEAKNFRGLTTAKIGEAAEADFKAVLAGDEPALRVQTLWFLGQLEQARKNWRQADSYFQQAVNIAEGKGDAGSDKSARGLKDPAIANYLMSWAYLPMFEFGDRFTKTKPASDDDRKLFMKEMQSRIDRFRSAPMPVEALIDPKLEADVLQARSTFGIEGDLQQALTILASQPDLIADGQCDFNLSQVNMLRARVDFRFALVQQHEKKKIVTDTEVADVIKDAYKLTGSKMVSPQEKSFLYDKCAAARLAIQFSDPPPSLATTTEYKKTALKDYQFAVDSAIKAERPGLAAQFRYSRSVVGYLCAVGVTEPKEKKQILTDALADAQEAQRYFDRYGYPDNYNAPEFAAKIVKIQDALKNLQ